MEKWLIAIVLLVLTINAGFLNYVTVKEIRKPICVFDVQKFIDFLASQHINEEEADLLLTKAKNFLERSECKAVFVKGALITGHTRDVTEDVISVVKDIHSKATK